jgi:26S proteasome regulatory subunit N6
MASVAVERLAVSVSNEGFKGKDAAAAAASSSLSSSVEYPTNEALAMALENKDSNPTEAIALLREILDHPSSTSEVLRIKEQAITALSDILSREKKAEELRSLLTDLRPYFNLVPKAKTAKIVRGIIDAVAKIPGTSNLQISLCREMVEWTRSEKRMFLRQRVEARLAALLMENKEYVEALSLLTNLVREVRRLDDKLLLVDIDLLECKLHFSLRNLPKAKAALTAARTAANAIYVPPAQQGTIDLQSGILHAEEKDYKTGFSYFFEAFEAFNALEDPRAVFCLKYMLLCKIMTNQADDVGSLISSKARLEYTG